MQTDPIADMLTRIRNAGMIGKRQVVMPGSKIKTEVARILKDEGFIADYKVGDEIPQASLVLTLKYSGYRKSVISGLERVSRPGRRVYVSYRDIPWVRSGLGINILSTPKGLLTGRQAHKAQVGGEVICNIW